jgi:imidazole glycerol-phosphate synthase subunit HisH
MIVIVDYGAGNLQSVKNALDKLNVDSLITDDREAILNAEKVIFPGQGHFGACVSALIQKGLFEVIKEVALNKPFLGICVGMQLLFERSAEAPGVPGLGILEGEVIRFKEGQKLPQIGWNQVQCLEGRQFFYFAHSYYCVPEDKKIIAGSALYTEPFACIVAKNQLLAVQFHPEKSGKQGLLFLDNFLRREKC